MEVYFSLIFNANNVDLWLKQCPRKGFLQRNNKQTLSRVLLQAKI